MNWNVFVAALFVAASFGCQESDSAARSTATLRVTATEGEILEAWLEREGEPPQKIGAESADLRPGKVCVRVIRRMSSASPEIDAVRIDLHARRRHLVAVGDAPVRALTKFEGRDRELTSRYLTPGIVAVDPAAGGWVIHEEASAAPPGQEPPLIFPPVAPGEGGPVVTAGDQVLVVNNPYLQPVEVRVRGPGWEREMVLPGRTPRVVPIGRAGRLEVESRLLPGLEILERRAFNLAEGLPFFTVGGRTLYRWIASAPCSGPPVPQGAVAFLPSAARLRIAPAANAIGCRIFVQLSGVEAGLYAFVSAAPPVRGRSRPLLVQSGTEVAELQLPDVIGEETIASVATDGTRLVAVAGGAVRDFVTGAPLHAPGPIDVCRAVAGPSGLILLTSDGRLAVLRDGNLVAARPVGDPSSRIAPVLDEVPAVWLYGGAVTDGLCSLQRAFVGDSADGRALQGSDPVTALHPLEESVVLAALDRRIVRMDFGAGAPAVASVLVLPEGSPSVIGLADLEGRLFFATEDGVWAVQGAVVAPLVEGIGGDLHRFRGGLLVHDRRSFRLYHLTGAPFAGEAGRKAR